MYDRCFVPDTVRDRLVMKHKLASILGRIFVGAITVIFPNLAMAATGLDSLRYFWLAVGFAAVVFIFGIAVVFWFVRTIGKIRQDCRDEGRDEGRHEGRAEGRADTPEALSGDDR